MIASRRVGRANSAALYVFLLAAEVERAHELLDTLGIPRGDTPEGYTLSQRIRLLNEKPALQRVT